MTNRITDRLTTVRLRHQFRRGFQCAALGLLVGALLGCVLLLLQRASIVDTGAAAWLTVFSTTILGLAAGLVWPTNWKSTAAAVDAAYDLKDRSLTAVDFAQRAQPDQLQRMQVADALQHLEQVDPEQVVPMGIPRLAVPAVCGFVVMVAMALVPTAAPPAADLPQALPVVLEQAQVLEDTLLEELQQLVKEHDEPELEELAEEIQEAIEELKQPDVDQREALAKLSEMQQAVAQANQQLDVEQVDAQLEQLAEALQAAEATQAASQALQSQNYEQAASELEKIDASSMERKEREAVKSNLAKLSKKLGEGRKGQLSDAVADMLDGLEKERESQCKSGMCKAAGVCRKQGIRKKISQCLNCQLNRLAECKSCCQGGNCDKSGPSQLAKKSESPSNSWGTAASGQPLGEEETQLDSTRRDESLTGVAGDGPSERERLSTPEARQDAARAYQDRYAEYRKQMEEVLDTEPLPLGHRQTVRTYFEAIRPENGQDVLGE